jgi:hypothetical protein
MARIQRFTSRVQADLACSMLRSNGVDARVSSDDAGGLHPDIPFGIGGTVVVVPDEDLELATALLDEEPDGYRGDHELAGTTPGERRGRGALRIGSAVVALAFLLLAITGLIGFYRF